MTHSTVVARPPVAPLPIFTFSLTLLSQPFKSYVKNVSFSSPSFQLLLYVWTSSAAIFFMYVRLFTCLNTSDELGQAILSVIMQPISTVKCLFVLKIVCNLNFLFTVCWFLIANSYVLLSQARYWRAIPELILGCLCLTGAAFCLLLQETTNKALPRTLEEGETFGEGEALCGFACCCKRRRSIAASP